MGDDQARPLRIAAWCGVSSKQQAADDKDSLPYQEAQAREFARAVGGEVVKIYRVGHTRDYWSWSEIEQDVPAYREVREDLQAGRLDVVHCVDSDRLGRDPALIQQFYSLAARNDVEVYDASMPHVLGQQSVGHRYGVAVKSVAAGEDQQRRVSRHRMGMRRRAREGLHPSRWPLGYTPIFDSAGNCTGAEFDEYIEAVKLITRLFLDGVSYVKILRALWNAGHVLPEGKRWYQSLIRRTMLHDTYAGYVEWGGARNEEPSARFPALWDEDTFRAIIRERERRTKLWNHPKGGPFSGGVALCARCGWRMGRNKSRHEGIYYLRCAKHARRSQDPDGTGCHPNHILESDVMRSLAAWLQQFDSAEAIASAALEDTGQAELERDRARHAARMEELEAERRRLARAYASGAMALEVYAEVNAEITAELDRAEAGLHAAEASIRARPEPEERVAWLEVLVSEPFRALDQVPDNDLNAALRGAGIQIYCEKNQVKVIGFAV